MKTIKVMSIIGIVFSVVSFFAIMSAYGGFYGDDSGDMGSAVGWGSLMTFYSLAFFIVALVASGRHSRIEK